MGRNSPSVGSIRIASERLPGARQNKTAARPTGARGGLRWHSRRRDDESCCVEHGDAAALGIVDGGLKRGLGARDRIAAACVRLDCEIGIAAVVVYAHDLGRADNPPLERELSEIGGKIE